MKFDVVIGNPPYNGNIYLDFVMNAFEMANDCVIMITPAMWNGRISVAQNDIHRKFREKIVPHMRKIVWYPSCRDVFKIYEVGGICYYLIDKGIYHTKEVENIGIANKALCDKAVLMEDKSGQTIFGKTIRGIIKKCSVDKSLADRTGDVATCKYMSNTTKVGLDGDIKVYTNGLCDGYLTKEELRCTDGLDKYKVAMVGKVGYGSYTSDSDKTGMIRGLGQMYIIGPNKIPSYNYKILGTFDTLEEAINYRIFLTTKLCRFLIQIGLSNSWYTKDAFRFAPDIMNYKAPTSDNILYKRYNLSDNEINLIEAYMKDREPDSDIIA